MNEFYAMLVQKVCVVALFRYRSIRALATPISPWRAQYGARSCAMFALLHTRPFCRLCAHWALRAYAAMRLRRRLGVLEIDDFDFFSHLFEARGEFVDEVHLDVEVDGQIGVLVSGIDGASDEEVDVGGFFEEESADR